MKKCEEFQEMISTYVDGELADAGTSKLFFHLGECSDCRTFMRSVLQLRSALQEIESTAQVSSSVSVWKRKFSVPYPVAVVVALMVMLSGFFLFSEISEPPKIVERIETQYVYMTSFPPVYVFANSSSEVNSN